ncbi:MAG: AIR synthase [Anaerolineaceae bacterium]|nr:AIR synthase [Anaerolineaceae bacterium]
MKIKNDEMIKVGKLPAETLKKMLSIFSESDPALMLGPGIGLDCAVIDIGDQFMVVKSDPITFATREIGWYAVQIISNDIYTTGSDPKWILPTIFLPENLTTREMTLDIARQLKIACDEKNIIIAGGHTEVTAGLTRPIISCTAIGFMEKQKLLSPKNIRVGDQIILTKGIPIEGVAILANEFEKSLRLHLDKDQIELAKNYIHVPGISVETEKKIACRTAMIHAMHDPTEGGLAGALWELAEACDRHFLIDPDNVLISPFAKNICEFFEIDPWCTIASGALLIVAPQKSATEIVKELAAVDIPSSIIGTVIEGIMGVSTDQNNEVLPLHRPDRDEIARLFEGKNFND